MDWLDFLKQVPVPVATFVLGFFTSRLTMSKKEREDVSQNQFENAKKLMESQQATFQDFAAALQKYANKRGKPSLTDFFDIATTGEKYFYQTEDYL